MPRVIIWKSVWLPHSETFIRNHQKSLERWEPTCVGTYKVTSPLSAEDDVILYRQTVLEQVRRRLFALTGYDPRVHRAIKDMNPQVIHAHFSPEAMRIRSSAKKLHVPLIVTLHGQDITEAPNRPGLRGIYYRLRLRRVFRDASRILAVSRHLADKAIALGASPEKVTVHYLGVPGGNAPEINSLESGSGIIAVGRLVEKKGFSHLIRAVSLIPVKNRSSLTIVGDGPLMQPLKELAQELGVAVHFVGRTTHEHTMELISSSSIVCVPSVVSQSGDEEGLPTVAMEAGLCSRAVVGYRHSGIPEIVLDGQTGLLVDEGDIISLSSALRILLDDPGLAAELGAAGLARVRSGFISENQTKDLEAIYDIVSKAR